jgi:hypothetical protein
MLYILCNLRYIISLMSTLIEWTHAEVDGKLVLPLDGIFTFPNEWTGKEVTFTGIEKEVEEPS